MAIHQWIVFSASAIRHDTTPWAASNRSFSFKLTTIEPVKISAEHLIRAGNQLGRYRFNSWLNLFSQGESLPNCRDFAIRN
jgi:hypothetical protein